MPTRDTASDQNVIIGHSAAITTDTTTNGTAIDVSDYDDGFLVFAAIPAWTDGTYVVTLQDSPDNSVWTAVPTAKVIAPSGTASITLAAATTAGSSLERLGAFSVNQYVRASIVSTATTSGATVTVYFVRKAELKPAV